MTGDDRITKLEEATAFAERTIDQLSDELRRAHDRIATLTARIEDLRSRIADLERADATADDDDDEVHPSTDPALERPPHAAGPKD